MLKSSSFSMVLKENELRVGNIISSSEKRYEILSGNNLQKVMSDLPSYAPVFITENILMKAGFIKSKKNNFYRLNKIEDYYLIFTGKIGMMYKVDRGSVGMPIRFLHELQNTYYYLSGQEINIQIEEC